LNIEKAIVNLKRPLFIAHGDQDLAVPIAEAEMLYSWADKSLTEFFKIYGCGHTFDIIHPFAGTTKKFEDLLDATNRFFVNKL
ncbi:MAG: alpha/beta hydrolase, partial [Melioribacteraceae bacterium]